MHPLYDCTKVQHQPVCSNKKFARKKKPDASKQCFKKAIFLTIFCCNINESLQTCIWSLKDASIVKYTRKIGCATQHSCRARVQTTVPKHAKRPGHRKNNPLNAPTGLTNRPGYPSCVSFFPPAPLPRAFPPKSDSGEVGSTHTPKRETRRYT